MAADGVAPWVSMDHSYSIKWLLETRMKRGLLGVIAVMSIVLSIRVRAIDPSSNPEPPLFPSAEDVTSQENEALRITNYRVSSTPDQVLEWYKDVLSKQGWLLRHDEGEHLTFGYITTLDEPSFRLDIWILGVEDPKTRVEVHFLTEYVM